MRVTSVRTSPVIEGGAALRSIGGDFDAIGQKALILGVCR